MLNGIRKAATNWLGRAVLIVIMSFLILSFAVWGIADMLRVQGGTTVASVGGVEIGSDQVRRSYQNALEEMSQRARRRITNEEAKALGLDRQVISRLITEATLDQRAGKLGLSLSEADVVASVTNDPTFRGPDGRFDRQKLFELIRQAGLNEPLFLAEQKKSMLRRQIGAGIAGEMSPSNTMLEAANRYLTEKRDVSYFVLSAAAAGDIAAVTDEALKAFYEGRKTEFRAPEFRKVNILAALPAELGIDLTITDADLRNVFDRGLASGRFGAPAKRQAQQILYPTESEAMAAALRLAGGATFDTLMADRKIKPEDADLGLKTKAQFVDPAIANAVFSTNEGAVSIPVKSGFGYALLRVTKIDPGTEQAFDDVKASLTDEARALKLRTDARIQARLDDIQKKIEDARTAGKSLAEAAPASGLTLRTIDAVSAAGTDKAKARVELAGGDETLKAIFQSDIGLDNEVHRLKEGGLLWFEIAGVESARDLAFEEVKPEALLRWKADESNRRLVEKATALVKRLDAGEDIAAVAKDAGSEVKEASITRREGGAIGATAAAQAFAVKVGGAASAPAQDGGRVILKVTDAAVPPLDLSSGLALELKKQIGEQSSDDLLSQYVQRLQVELGATVNQRMLQTAIGGGS